MPLVVVCVTETSFMVLAEMYVVAMFAAALAFVAVREQWPLGVIPVTVTLSEVAAVVAREAVSVSQLPTAVGDVPPE